MSICLVEFRGLAAAFSIADEMLKAADIKLQAYKNSGSAYISLLFSGDVSALNHAAAAGRNAANTMIEFAKKNAPLAYDYGLSKNFYSIVISKPKIDVQGIFLNNTSPKRITIKNKAAGFIDTKGLVAAVAAADAMGKSSNVDICGYEKMGSGELSVVVCGSIEDVTNAVEIGLAQGMKYGRVQNSSIIAKPDEEMYLML